MKNDFEIPYRHLPKNERIPSNIGKREERLLIGRELTEHLRGETTTHSFSPAPKQITIPTSWEVLGEPIIRKMEHGTAELTGTPDGILGECIGVEFKTQYVHRKLQ